MDDSNSQTYLVIGGTGLIGGACVGRLALSGVPVHCVDRRVPGRHLPQSVRFQQCDVLEEGALSRIFLECNPTHIINAINLATIFSRNPESGYDQIIRFYTGLYDALVALEKVSSKPIHYLQMGTTGSGGLGFNIPFTHGDRLEDLPIIHKAAFAGITTSMLTLISRSFGTTGRVTVSEIKPGLAIFQDEIQHVRVKGANYVTLAGGESGDYTREEVEELTKLMGFTTVSRIVDTVEEVLKSVEKGEAHECDVIACLNKAIIAEDDEGKAKKMDYIEKMRNLEGDSHIIATGNLGPSSLTVSLLEKHAEKHGADASSKITKQFLTENSTSY